MLHQDPSGQSLWWAVRYVLSVPTNRVLIVASALGYFFFSGLRTFAVVFLRERFGMGQGEASTLLVAIGIGAIVGVLVTGRLSDRLIDRRHITARPVVGGICFMATAARCFCPVCSPPLCWWPRRRSSWALPGSGGRDTPWPERVAAASGWPVPS